VGNEQKE